MPVSAPQPTPLPPRRRLLLAGAASLLLHLFFLRPAQTPPAPGTRLTGTLHPSRPPSRNTPASPVQRSAAPRQPHRPAKTRSEPATGAAPAEDGTMPLSDLQLAAYRLALYQALPEDRTLLASAIGEWQGEAALILSLGPDAKPVLDQGRNLPPALAATLHRLTLDALHSCPQPPPLSARTPTIMLAYRIAG
ncbi:hypothetical protein VX159_07515 [Dechloromonas sp. ZY10]|uniref:hypothetical protein n=1 Tax=Dechloromonas aquae TaxID=2664436 RepID=UPI0035298390